MSTRKLILWALICGVLILVAGSAKLFQTSQKPVEVQLLALGESVTLGDMTVSVTALRDIDDRTLVGNFWPLEKYLTLYFCQLVRATSAHSHSLKNHLYVPLHSLCLKARAPSPMFAQESNVSGRQHLDTQALLLRVTNRWG